MDQGLLFKPCLHSTKPLTFLFKVPATCLDISVDAKTFVGNQFNDVCVWTTAPEESLWHAGQKGKKAKAAGKRPAESPVIVFSSCIWIISCDFSPNCLVCRRCRRASVILQMYCPAKSGTLMSKLCCDTAFFIQEQG
jgi:hypothetical protein